MPSFDIVSKIDFQEIDNAVNNTTREMGSRYDFKSVIWSIELDKKENWDNWINFATKYGFVSYRDGKVPVLINYESGNATDLLVYHNDVIKDGVVEVSFFDDLIGQSLSDNELIKIHNERTIEFLDKYL